MITTDLPHQNIVSKRAETFLCLFMTISLVPRINSKYWRIKEYQICDFDKIPQLVICLVQIRITLDDISLSWQYIKINKTWNDIVRNAQSSSENWNVLILCASASTLELSERKKKKNHGSSLHKYSTYAIM